MTCAEIHGTTGLDGVDIPEHPEYKTLIKEQDENYLWNIYKKITDVNRPVTLIATGSLTNIALLLKVFPQVFYSEIILFFYLLIFLNLDKKFVSRNCSYGRLYWYWKYSTGFRI